MAHRLAPVINAVRVGRLGSALICSFFLHVTYIFTVLATLPYVVWVAGVKHKFFHPTPTKKILLAINIVIYYNFIVWFLNFLFPYLIQQFIFADVDNTFQDPARKTVFTYNSDPSEWRTSNLIWLRKGDYHITLNRFLHGWKLLFTDY